MTASEADGRPSRTSWSDDRRSSPRIEVEAELGFQSETNFFTGFSEDLSDGGLFIATWDTQAIGTELTVTFGLPEGREIKAHAKVMWVREPHGDITPGMGVRFHDLDDEDHKAILRFIEERPPVFYDA